MKNLIEKSIDGKRYNILNLEYYQDFSDEIWNSQLDLLPFEKCDEGSKRHIRYKLAHRIKLIDILKSPLDEEVFLKYLLSILDSLNSIIKSGFNEGNIFLDIDCMVFNIKTRKFEFIYVPIKNYRISFDVKKLILDIIYSSFYQDNRLLKVLSFLSFVKENHNLCISEYEECLVRIISENESLDEHLPSIDEDELTEYEEEITEIIPSVKYVLISNDRSIDLYEGVHILGRGMRDVDILINGSKKVSRKHLKFEIFNSDVLIYDLDSSNGTYINNRRIDANRSYSLNVGDLIRIGDLEYSLEKSDEYR